MGFWDRVKDAVTGETAGRQPESRALRSDDGRADRIKDTIDESASSPVEPMTDSTPNSAPDLDTSASSNHRVTPHEATHETYTVRIGDTLSEIGERFAVSHQDLAAFNDIANPDRIYPGQVIKIPHA